MIRNRYFADFLMSATGIVLVVAVGGCASSAPVFPLQEKFGSSETHSRLFDATPVETCEAGRRALLSQGYVINTTRPDLIEGRKNFQPDLESHMQIEIRFVCAAETGDGQVSLGFVTALQDRYALKKNNNSASLGVGVLGSVSLPFSSSSDSMVKVASETVSSPPFYDSFFDLVRRYLLANEGPGAMR